MVDRNAQAHDDGKTAATDDLALELAEKTDVSVNQARELLRKHGDDAAAAEKEARNFKAES